MYRKISGFFDAENGLSPIVFLPGFKVAYRQGSITVAKAAPLTGTPWPGTARKRRICLALDEKNLPLVNQIVPQISPRESSELALEMEILVDPSPGKTGWSFEFDSGIMKIFDNHGMEIQFSGERENTAYFMFRGKGFRQCRIIKGNWILSEKEGIFSCSAVTPEAREKLLTGNAGWLHAAEKKYAWWHEAFLLTRHLAGIEENRRLELLTAVQQMLMFPEESFYFDGNFSSWCSGMRKLKFSELLKARLLKICSNFHIWNYNAKCFAGIDDGLRLPRRCDSQGDPLELDWLGVLDASPSCLAAIEMFEYCNDMHDMEFLKDYAFDFMKQVMQVVELSIESENYRLFLPYAPLPGARADSLAGYGRNSDRQLYFIHALAERLIKACSMLGKRPDPVWQDIAVRLPKARGSWQLTPDTSWGKAGGKIYEMMY